MRTIAGHLRKGDILPDGPTVLSETPTVHPGHVSVVVRHTNGVKELRSYDRGRGMNVIRHRGATFGPIGGNPIIEDERANRASDAYERQIGL